MLRASLAEKQQAQSSLDHVEYVEILVVVDAARLVFVHHLENHVAVEHGQDHRTRDQQLSSQH